MTFNETVENFHLNSTEAFRLIATTQFRPFTKGDYECFAGVETAEPMYGENGDYALILDGTVVNIIHVDDAFGGQIFRLS